MLQRAFDGLGAEAGALRRSAFAFRLLGGHVGPLTTPVGDVAPTGRLLEVRGIDIYVIAGDVVTGVWAVADHLGLLIRAKAVALVREH